MWRFLPHALLLPTWSSVFFFECSASPAFSMATLRWADIKSSLRDGDSIVSVISAAVTRKSLFRIVRIFHKPAVKRSEEEVQEAAAFLWQHRMEYGYFRHASRSMIVALCRVMGALTVGAGHMVYDAGVRANEVGMGRQRLSCVPIVLLRLRCGGLARHPHARTRCACIKCGGITRC